MASSATSEPGHPPTNHRRRGERGRTRPDSANPGQRPERGGVAATPIGGGASIVDLHHLGRPRIIGVNVLDLAEGIALVDPGPEARMPTLRSGLAAMGRSLADVRAILLTHIHLDHATAAGAIVREAPGAVVFVHAAGAPHMVDPARLLASAGRIYGDAMETLWGRFLPVPHGSLRVVEEGEALALGGRRIEVAHVPGHAVHHVAYHEAATGTAWVGDVGGIRIGSGPALPVTPPPDIDVALWKTSMERVMAWAPDRIVATHFGPFEAPREHFAELGERLDAWAEWVRRSLAEGEVGRDGDRKRARAFARWVGEGLGGVVSRELAELYETASGFPDSWWGLARYWRKRSGA